MSTKPVCSVVSVLRAASLSVSCISASGSFTIRHLYLCFGQLHSPSVVSVLRAASLSVSCICASGSFTLRQLYLCFRQLHCPSVVSVLRAASLSVSCICASGSFTLRQCYQHWVGSCPGLRADYKEFVLYFEL
jgi:hypothetical protein